MRNVFALCVMAAAAASWSGMARAQEPVVEGSVEVNAAVGPDVDPDSFRPVLTNYGEWVEVPGYGTVWRPYARVVGVDFVPYSSGGHWVYTDVGWVWESDYPWGWAAFHYGNWVDIDGGWAWIPGRRWAPAWVEWRYGGGYVGWAPLGPAGVTVVRVGAPRYSYVEVNHFTAVNVREHVIVGAQAETIAVRTQPLPSARVVDGHYVAPINAGPRPTVIAQATGHAVTPVSVHTVVAAVPPASHPGVHYANGASAAHPVITQKGGEAQGHVAAAAAPAAHQVTPEAKPNPAPTTSHPANAPAASPHAAEPPKGQAMPPQRAEPAPRKAPEAHPMQPPQTHPQPAHAPAPKAAPKHAPAPHAEGGHAK
jgi:hypothetical protein